MAAEVLGRRGREKPRGVPCLRAGGAPPQAEATACVEIKFRAPHSVAASARWRYWLISTQAMDGKEEIRVVEEEPSWTGGSLESLDVIDKVPDESVKLATD